MASAKDWVRLGSAQSGVGNWWVQRVSALALIPLTLWFLAALIAHLGAGYGSAIAWLGSPFPAIAMVLLLVAGFVHLALGAKVIVEDYVHHIGVKLMSLLLVRLGCWTLGVAGVFAVLRIALRG